MSLELLTARVQATGNAISGTWSSIVEFSLPPRGVACEVVTTRQEFKARYKAFDPLIGNQLARIQQRLMADHGVDEQRRISLDIVRPVRDRTTASFPPAVLKAVDLNNAAYLATEFCLKYVAAAEKSRIGEAVFQCYPACGIPCGWDDDGGVLFLYHPDLK